MHAPDARQQPKAPTRPEILQSWRRAAILGLDPASPGVPTITDIDASSRLMVAAAPVLEELAVRLADQALCLILVDRAGRVVHESSGDARLQAALESNGVALGARLDEDAAGTNGPGTALEIGRGVEVNGSEHFLNALKGFSCYGHPIRHPLTRRIEGVLDITSVGGRANPLFGPLLAGAVRDIEARIVEGARESERRMFLAFQNATRLRSTPVAVLGGDLVLANRACLDRLGSADPAVLGTLLEGGDDRGRSVRELDLGPRGRIRVLIESIDQTAGNLFYLSDLESSKSSLTEPVDQPGVRRVLVAGEPGTGRTSAARDIFPAEGPLTVIDAIDALSGSEDKWVARLMTLLRDAPGPVLVDEVHLLPSRLCEVVRRTVDASGGRAVVLVACPVNELPEPAARLAALCETTIEPKPLRERVHELPALIAAMVQDVRPGSPLRLTARALAELAAHPWPGNLSELKRLVNDLARRPLAGSLDAADLPARYRSSARTTSLGGRERAERVAVIAALEATGGNKSLAAERLGISRTTLYRRMQALDIPG